MTRVTLQALNYSYWIESRKRCVFRRLWKTGRDDVDATWSGRYFQVREAATGKAMSPNVHRTKCENKQYPIKSMSVFLIIIMKYKNFARLGCAHHNAYGTVERVICIESSTRLETSWQLQRSCHAFRRATSAWRLFVCVDVRFYSKTVMSGLRSRLKWLRSDRRLQNSAKTSIDCIKRTCCGWNTRALSQSHISSSAICAVKTLL